MSAGISTGDLVDIIGVGGTRQDVLQKMSPRRPLGNLGKTTAQFGSNDAKRVTTANHYQTAPHQTVPEPSLPVAVPSVRVAARKPAAFASARVT